MVDGSGVEHTVALVKCGAVMRGDGAAVADVARSLPGAQVVNEEVMRLTRAQAEAFYTEHAGRPYFEGLVGSVTSGPVVAMELEGDGVVAGWRTAMGATDPSKAAPGTVRATYGKGMPDNAAHGSDSAASAAREAAILFPASGG